MTYMDNRGTGAAALSSELIGFLKDLRLAFRWKMAEEYSGMNMPTYEPRVVALVTDPDAVKRAIENARKSAASISANANCLSEVLQRLAADLNPKPGITDPATISYGEIGMGGIAWDCAKVDAYRRESGHYLNLLGRDAAALYGAQGDLFGSFILRHVCAPHPCDDPSYSPETWMKSEIHRAKADESGEGAQSGPAKSRKQ
jgi:hypothetical protein